MEEFMFLGLRKTKGISKKEFIERFGCSMDSVYGKPLIESMKQGMMKEEGDRVFLTQDGTLVSNQVLCEFLFDEEV
jgi:oxygen-independent coproporphyrinogen-3 oxidase